MSGSMGCGGLAVKVQGGVDSVNRIIDPISQTVEVSIT